jgi:hypothetical protein
MYESKKIEFAPGSPRDLRNDDLLSVAAQYCGKEARSYEARLRISVPDDI